MKKSRFSEDQIVSILKEVDAGIGISELCRKYGVTNQTVYRWRSKYGGMQVGDVRKMKTLEEENATLKRLLGQSKSLVTMVLSLGLAGRKNGLKKWELSSTLSSLESRCECLHRVIQREISR